MSVSVYTIPPPQTPLVDRDGIITRSWWRFLSSLFVTGGSGTVTVNLADLAAAIADLESAEGLFLTPRGPDYQAIIDMQAAQIAELQGRVSTLSAAVDALQRGVFSATLLAASAQAR